MHFQHIRLPGWAAKAELSAGKPGQFIFIHYAPHIPVVSITTDPISGLHISPEIRILAAALPDLTKSVDDSTDDIHLVNVVEVGCGLTPINSYRSRRPTGKLPHHLVEAIIQDTVTLAQADVFDQELGDLGRQIEAASISTARPPRAACDRLPPNARSGI
ncbi:hypothetical protein CDD83_11207 [Cordyceps sp. RAO-2017]|nr:hypothetical protein CDD83_11207 [Cordyceps sp. RAO-2017]